MAARGKVTGWTIRFLALLERACSQLAGFATAPELATQGRPPPCRPSCPSLPSGAAAEQHSPPRPRARVGDSAERFPLPMLRRHHAPARSEKGWSLSLMQESPYWGCHSELRVGGRCFQVPAFPLLSPHPKSESDVSWPEGGGAVGEAAWAAGCARTRACPGAPALPVFGERAGLLPPTPYNPHVSKGG